MNKGQIGFFDEENRYEKLRQHRTIDKNRKMWYNKIMEKQMTPADITDELRAARINKRIFLEKLDEIIPWKNFIDIIQPCRHGGHERDY